MRRRERRSQSSLVSSPLGTDFPLPELMEGLEGGTRGVGEEVLIKGAYSLEGEVKISSKDEQSYIGHCGKKVGAPFLLV